jgi:hypothetical protein
LHGENGIRFHGRGLVYGLVNTTGVRAQTWNRNGLTIELSLKPEIEPHRNLPVFLTIYDPQSLAAITVGQWRAGLIVRWRNLKTPLDFKEFGVQGALSAGERRLVAITFDTARSAVFVDGKLKRQHASNLLSSLDGSSIRFVLGNSPNGRDAWMGDLFALALYNRSLSPAEVSINYDSWTMKGLPSVSAQNGLVGLFTFAEKSGERAGNQTFQDGHLRVPRYFRPPLREILIPPWRDFQVKRTYLLDMLLNILGFIPFGLSFAVWSSRSFGLSSCKAISYTVFFSAVLSCSIELLQVWIPLRDSQLMDILMNTVGAFVGSLFVGRAGAPETA